QQGQRAAALIQLRNDETSAAAAAADAAGRWGDAEQLRYQAQVAALQDELARTVGLTDAEKQRRLQALADIETARQLGQIRQTAYTIEDAAFAVVLRRMRIQGQADDAERLAATRRIDLMIAELKARKAITEEQEKQLRLLLGISTAPLTDMEQTLQSLAEQAKRMGSLSSILDQLSAAWLTFWQAIGSGEGVEGGLKKVLQGMAQYLARWAMTQALLNIAKGIGGDPKGFAAAAAYMAAAAALAAFAGSMGGSGGGGGGGGNRYDATVRDREVITQTGPRLPRQPGYNPRLQPAGVSATAATAAQLRPPAPVVVNQTIIGERDPIAQRQIAAMTATAARRGYATTGGR
ncbi:MAG: hypothetical protein OEW44_07050, partial [Gemmatimonadota bacterium]|nr:hypothetical protein [Gemmatimonadota bacterium]